MGLAGSPLAGQTRGLAARTDSNTTLQLGPYHALLIAVQNYADPAVPPLDNPIRDARALRDVLVQRYRFAPGDVELLENPTQDTILARLYDLSEQLGDNANLLLFFAGHGQWDERSQQGYWLPADARRANTARWISNSTIRDALRRVRARHALIISDACFSGGIFRTRDLGVLGAAPLARLYQRPSRKAMTSGSRELVPDRSRFLEFLVARLRDNGDALLPASDLFARLRNAVMNNSPVTPQYGTIYDAGDQDGEFLFPLRAGAGGTVHSGRDAVPLNGGAGATESRAAPPSTSPGSRPDVDGARRALAARNIPWTAASLGTALAAGDLEVMQLFLDGGAEPGMMAEALGSAAGSGGTVAAAFFKRAMGNAAAIDWLRAALKRGLDPNITTPGGYYAREGLLIAAVRAGNAPAVIALVEGGASPHAYQDLWLTPYPVDRFILAFEAVLSADAFTRDEKKAILEHYLAAGGIIPSVDGMTRDGETYQTEAIKRVLAESQALAGVKLVPTATLAARPRTPVCEFASKRDGFDWCAFTASLPRRIVRKPTTSVYAGLLDIELLGLMNVVDGKAYLMGVQRGYFGPGYMIVEVSRDAQLWRIYRYMSPEAGMGICKQGQNETGAPPNECWRRVSMRYDAARGVMLLENYYEYAAEKAK